MSTTLDSSPVVRLMDTNESCVLEVTWVRAMKMCWSGFWRGVLCSLLVFFALGFAIGLVGSAAGVDKAVLNRVAYESGRVMTFPVAFLVGIGVTRVVLRKSWSDFRVILVPRNSGVPRPYSLERRGLQETRSWTGEGISTYPDTNQGESAITVG